MGGRPSVWAVALRGWTLRGALVSDWLYQRLPLPLDGAQVSVTRDPGGGWQVSVRVLQAGAGWALAGTYHRLVTPEALDVAVAELCALFPA